MTRVRTALLTILLFSLFLGGLGQAQQSIDSMQWKAGFHGFNTICDDLGLNHLTLQQLRQTPANETIMVLVGTELASGEADRFLRNGGAVLVLTEQRNRSVWRHGYSVEPFSYIAINNPEDRYRNYSDCPIIRNSGAEHPVMSDVESLVANRPGRVFNIGGRDVINKSTIAYLPEIGRARSERELGFIAVAENPVGGKLCCIADSSIFNNQMLVCHDNALLAQNVMEWLSSESRKNVFLLVNDQVQQPVMLDNADFRVPPPSREEILDALRNLPPSMLLEFGNEIASVVEDENMINEFLTSMTDRIRPKAMNRFLIFLAFSAACLISFFVYVGQKRNIRQTASDIATAREKSKKYANKYQEAAERKQAVEVLLDAFCVDTSHRNFQAWPEFPEGIVEPRGKPDHGKDFFPFIFEAMNKLAQNVRLKPNSYWTTKRLLQAEADLNHWRQYYGLAPFGSESSSDSGDDVIELDRNSVVST